MFVEELLDEVGLTQKDERMNAKTGEVLDDD
jgi:hypothetical protein